MGLFDSILLWVFQPKFDDWKTTTVNKVIEKASTETCKLLTLFLHFVYFLIVLLFGVLHDGVSVTKVIYIPFPPVLRFNVHLCCTLAFGCSVYNILRSLCKAKCVKMCKNGDVLISFVILSILS